MRNITKPIRLAIRPNPILRFDDEDNFSKLVTPSFNRHIASKKGLIDRHAQILALSAAEANSVCLASNQIGLESRLIAISKNITNQKDKTINWIN